MSYSCPEETTILILVNLIIQRRTRLNLILIPTELCDRITSLNLITNSNTIMRSYSALYTLPTNDYV